MEKYGFCFRSHSHSKCGNWLETNHACELGAQFYTVRHEWQHKLFLLYSWAAVLWWQTQALCRVGDSLGSWLCGGNTALWGECGRSQPVLRQASSSAPTGAQCHHLFESPLPQASDRGCLSHEAHSLEALLELAALGQASSLRSTAEGSPALLASPLADLLQPSEDQAGQCTRLFRCSLEGSQSATLSSLSIHPIVIF